MRYDSRYVRGDTTKFVLNGHYEQFTVGLTNLTPPSCKNHMFIDRYTVCPETDEDLPSGCRPYIVVNSTVVYYFFLIRHFIKVEFKIHNCCILLAFRQRPNIRLQNIRTDYEHDFFFNIYIFQVITYKLANKLTKCESRHEYLFNSRNFK